MFAEADPSAKEKFLEIISFVFARRKRIAEALGLEKIESASDDCVRIRISRPPRLREFAGPRADRRRHLEQTFSFARLQILTRHLQGRSHFVAPLFHDWLPARQIIAGHEGRTGGSCNWSIQSKHPERAVRLDRDPLANGGATAKLLRRGGRCLPETPFHSVAVCHDKAAPIKSRARGKVVVGKFSAKGNGR